MNIKKFEDAMNEIDEKYINEALEYKKKAKKPVYIKITAAAACFAAAVLIGFSILPGYLEQQSAQIAGEIGTAGSYEEEISENADGSVAGADGEEISGNAEGSISEAEGEEMAGGDQTGSASDTIYIEMDDIAVNAIENYGTSDMARYNADTDIEVLWDMDAIVEYFGRDISPSYIPDGLIASENNGTGRVFEKPDGGLSEDTVYFRFYSGYYEDGSPELTDEIPAKKGFSVIASKLGIPCDCVYAAPDNEVKASKIAGTEVTFGHYPVEYGPYDANTNEPAGVYDMYIAEFELDGAEYQIVVEQMGLDEIVKVTASVITGSSLVEVG